MHLLDAVPAWNARLRALSGQAGPRDAAEPWEIPLPREERFEVGRRLVDRPLRPTKAEDVPASALPALETACGPLLLEHLFVVPRTTRLVTPRQCIITPAEVLAFGETIVGLWIDDGPDGRVLSIPIDRLIAVDDCTILLYGRLRLMARDRRLVVRYNTVSRRDLQENLCELRGRMATRRQTVESGFLWLDPRDERMRQPDLPHKWRLVLEQPTVRPDPGEPAIIAVGDVSKVRSRQKCPPAGVAVLGSRELVIATEPVEFLDGARYGIDLLAVPRERLDSLSWDGRSLTVHLARDRADGAIVEGTTSITLAPEPRLVEAMRRAFGPAVQWA